MILTEQIEGGHAINIWAVHSQRNRMQYIIIGHTTPKHNACRTAKQNACNCQTLPWTVFNLSRNAKQITFEVNMLLKCNIKLLFWWCFCVTGAKRKNNLIEDGLLGILMVLSLGIGICFSLSLPN